MRTNQLLLAILATLFSGLINIQAQDSLTVQFELEQHRLTKKTKRDIKETLEKIAPVEGYFFQVIGHTDNRGRSSYNMRLSKRRAKAVRNYLVKLNIESEIIVANGKGENNPKYENSTRENRIKNRRVVVRWRRNSEKAGVPVQIFNIYDEGTTLITTNKGCTFKLKGSDFTNLKGEPVQEGLQLFVKEYDSPAEFILEEIPMDDHKNETMYESFSMFSINAFKDTIIPLKLSESAYIKVNCDLPKKNEDIDFFKFDKFEDKWDNLGNIEDISKHDSRQIKDAPQRTTALDSEDMEANVDSSATPKEDGMVYDLGSQYDISGFISNAEVDSAEQIMNGKYAVVASLLPGELLQKESPCNTDLCYFGENLNGLQFFNYDPSWYLNAQSYLNEEMINLSYKKHWLLNKAKLKLELSPYMFGGSDEINKTTWKHKLSEKTKAFEDRLQSKEWDDIDLKPIKDSKKYHLLLKSNDIVDTIVVSDSWWKKTNKPMLRGDIDDLQEMKVYLEHECFWKRNQPFMTSHEQILSMNDWFNLYENNQTVFHNKYAYLYTKRDSILKNEDCKAEGGKALDSKSNGSIYMRELGIYNYDKVISTKDFLKVNLSFNDQNGNEINPIYTYTIIQSLNGLLQFKSTLRESKQEIKTQSGVCTLIFVEDAAGNIWISESKTYNNSTPQSLELKKVSDKMKSYDEVKELLDFSCPSEG